MTNKQIEPYSENLKRKIKRSDYTDHKSELALLQRMMVEPDCVYDLEVTKEDFDHPIHADLFEIMLRTITETMSSTEVLSRLTDPKIREYFDKNVMNGYGNFESAQYLIKRSSVQRKIFDFCAVTPRMMSDMDLDDTLDHVQSYMHDFSNIDLEVDTITAAQAGIQAMEFLQ